MKAIQVQQFGDPSVLEIREIPVPSVGPGQVLVKILAAGVNPVEAYIRTGTYPIKVPLPYTPGSDGAGIVEAVGPGVTTFKPGDRVYTAGTLTGTYAQFALADASTLFPLPEALNFDQGAAIYVPYSTAYRALLEKAGAQAGESLLIHGGSGAVGIAAIQLAKSLGLTIIATSSTETGRQLLKQQGVHHALDHHSPAHYPELAAITQNRGVDIILEMLANKNLESDFGAAAKFGRIVIIGNRGTIEINPRGMMGKDLTVTGMTLNNVTPAGRTAIQHAMAPGFATGLLKPIIDEAFPLEQAPAAHEAVMQNGSHGKIVLHPWNA